MTTFEHQPDCDGAHTLRQRCNTRGAGDASAGTATPVAVPHGARDAAPAEHADGALSDERREQAPGTGAGSAEQSSDAIGDDAAPPSSRAIADGPLDPIDTGGFPILPLIGVGAATLAVLVGVHRLLRRRSARD